MDFEQFTVVRVPFPFTDKAATKNRPALILSGESIFNAAIGHSVMVMITSQSNPAWPLDYFISNLDIAGLPVPSVVRFKLFTLDNRLVRGEIGHLSKADIAVVRKSLVQLLGFGT